jgi:hypothetical protein
MHKFYSYDLQYKSNPNPNYSLNLLYGGNFVHILPQSTLCYVYRLL